MKKFLVIPIMFLYLIAMSGVMVHAHYCGKQLASWNINEKTDGCGDEGCGNESGKTHKCCKDKVVAAKVSQDQNHVDFFKLKTSLPTIEASLPTALFILSEPINTVHYRSSANQPNAPPGLWENIPLYKLHSSFTYYG
jgi:hypothetical protein